MKKYATHMPRAIGEHQARATRKITMYCGPEILILAGIFCISPSRIGMDMRLRQEPVYCGIGAATPADSRCFPVCASECEHHSCITCPKLSTIAQ